MVNRVVIHQFVDLSRGHSFMYLFRNQVEHTSVDHSTSPDSLNLLRSLQDREIELGDQGLVRPLRPFLIVVPELGGPRHDQDKDHEKHGQGDETVFELGQFQIHNKLSII